MAGIIDEQFMSMFGGKDAAPAPTVAQNQQAGAGLQPPPTTQTPPAAQAAVQPSPGGIIDNQFQQMFGNAPNVPPEPNSGQSPDTATDVSPVSFTDRLKMSMGNDAGSVAYLKQQYQDAKQLPDGRIVVKKDGKWGQADPSGMGGGNAWDKAKEFAKDLADGGGVALNAGVTAGALALSPFTGGATIPVAGAAGLASGGIRTSLGRVVGTYQATPEEQLKDVTLEGLLNAGGETIGLGAKPYLGKVANAVKSFASDASDGAKQAMASFLSWGTKAAPESTTRLLDRAPEVMGKITDVQASGMPSFKTDNGIVSNAMDDVKSLFSNPQKALSQKFDGMESNLLQSVPDSFQADIAQPIHQTMMGLAQQGMVRPIANEAGQVTGYRLAPKDDILKLFKNAEEDGSLTQDAWLKLNQFVGKANGYLDAGTKTGSDAVDTLMNIRRGFDKFYYAATDANQNMKQLLTAASSQLRSELVRQIGSASEDVAKQYASMNQMYQDTMPFVVEAGRTLRRFNGAEAFVNRLSGGDKVMPQRLMDIMSGLKGDAGQQLADSIKDNVAARDFVARLPTLTPGRAAVAAAAGTASHYVPGVAPIAAAATGLAAVGASPRFVGRSVQGASAGLEYASKFGDMLKSMAPDQMKQFISDPNLFPAAVRATLQAGRTEDGMAQQLLQSHGINPNQRQGASQ